MQAIDSKLAQAKLAQQKLLIVLGANWCHDSQGLIQRFASNEMSSLLQENYQTLFVDIGYYEKGFDVVSRFGMPIYYGTPHGYDYRANEQSNNQLNYHAKVAKC